MMLEAPWGLASRMAECQTGGSINDSRAEIVSGSAYNAAFRATRTLVSG